MVNIAVLGYGTVGSGVVEVIHTNHERINQRIGDELNVKYVLDLRDFPGDPIQKKLVHDFNVIVEDPDVQIVVEVMGGIEPAYPEADVEGYDACRKIAILSSLISGQQVDFEDIYTEGITNITKEDMMYAKEMGMTIKLLASSKRDNDHLHAIVAPALLHKEHPLYNVNDVFNAIFVHGNVLGDAMFYGSGAGKLPTASAVVADVVDGKSKSYGSFA